jgi:hypothetical protein
MTMNHDHESWARVKPDAFLTGSIVQARNVIEMAVQDIATLAAERDRAIADLARWRSAFQSATPGGSEFMTPESVRDYMQSLKADTVRAKIDAVAARKEVRAARANLDIVIAAAEAHAEYDCVDQEHIDRINSAIRALRGAA